jgi:5-formyltetrahydrofolate cyclo-ligase
VHFKTKKELRERILTLLRSQQAKDRLKKSLLIKEKLFKMPEFKKAETILFYAPFDGEVDTVVMMKEALNLGKEIGLPKIIKELKKIVPFFVKYIDDLEEGSYGIREPKSGAAKAMDLDVIDMVIVPGVAFDKQKNRLGRGGGYYDRFLPSLPVGIPTVGLAFDFQIVDHLPDQRHHDIAVSHLLINS